MDKANHRAPDLSAPDRSASDPRAGFTLIEIMVVVLLLGLVGQLVVGNMGRWIPESSLDSQVSQLRSWIDYLRSEAKVQGKPYSLELDLENHRTRLILPEEDKLVRTDDDTVASTIPMAWEDLEKWMKFDGHAFAGRPIFTKGTVEITFDENVAESGGAIAFSPGDNSWDLTVTDSTFESNEATDDGAALYASKGELIELRGVDFLRGSAGEDGGALVRNLR